MFVLPGGSTQAVSRCVSDGVRQCLHRTEFMFHVQCVMNSYQAQLKRYLFPFSLIPSFPCLPPLPLNIDDARTTVESSLRLLSTAIEVTEDEIVRPKTHPASPSRSTSSLQDVWELAKMDMEKQYFDRVVETGYVHLLLAHYRNQLLHLFVPEALVAMSLHGNTPCDRGGRHFLRC